MKTSKKSKALNSFFIPLKGISYFDAQDNFNPKSLYLCIAQSLYTHILEHSLYTKSWLEKNDSLRGYESIGYPYNIKTQRGNVLWLSPKLSNVGRKKTLAIA